MKTSTPLSMADLRRLTTPNYAVPLAYLLWDWAVILATAFAATTWPHPAVYILATLIIGGRQHALFVLIHEGVHKHLARRKTLNDLIASWFAAFPLLFDMQAYRVTHLKHHEHLNTDQDPDWVRKRGRREWCFPVAKWKMAAYIPFFVLIWGPIEWALIVIAFSGVLNRNTYMSAHLGKQLLQKAIFYSLAVFLLFRFELWTPVLLYWFVPLFFVFPLVQRIRSIAEHFGLAWAHEYNSSRDVSSNWLENSIFSPHAVSYHLSHHIYPAVPCYRLKALHKKLLENREFAQNAHINRGYLLGFDRSVLADITREPKRQAQSRVQTPAAQDEKLAA